MKLQKHIGTIIIVFGLILIIVGFGELIYYNIEGRATIKWSQEVGELSPGFQEILKETLQKPELVMLAEAVLRDIPRQMGSFHFITIMTMGNFFGWLLIVFGLIVMLLGIALRQIIRTLQK